jgi:LacI family transcriptional regulator
MTVVKKVTMQQIADQLGVSKFVISKALSGRTGVSAVTRERVIQTAAQLGYVINKGPTIPNSQQMGTLHTDKMTPKKSVIVLMPNIRFQTKENLYWGRVLEGISSELAQLGLGMVIINEQTDHLLDILNPEGFIGMIGVGLIPTDTLLQIHNLGIPLVLIDHEDPLIPADSIFTNNYDGIVRLTNHLIALGHQNIRFIGNTGYSRSFLERWTGFRVTVEQHSDQAVDRNNYLFPYEHSEIHQSDKFNKWLAHQMKQPNRPTAFVCANDQIALVMIDMLNEQGYTVPGDVSVTGYDNIEDAYYSNPGLTTVNVPKEVLGRRSVEMLLHRTNKHHDPLTKVMINGDFIIRGSIGAAKGS